jgi:hypothetical protein
MDCEDDGWDGSMALEWDEEVGEDSWKRLQSMMGSATEHTQLRLYKWKKFEPEEKYHE